MATAKTDFSISANVIADTSQVQKTLNQDQKKWKIKAQLDVDTKMAETKVKNLFQSSSLNGFDRINTKIKTNVTGIDEYGNKVKGVIKYTETFKNSIGDVYEKMTLLTKGGQVVGQSLEKIQNGISNITTDTRTATQTINGFENKITTVTKTMTDTANQTRTVVETTREWTDASGRLNTEITTTNAQGEQLAPTITKVTDATNKASSANKNLGNSATQASKQMQGLGWTLTDAFKRLANFYLASLPLKAFQTAITNTTEIVKNFDAAITEMGKVSSYSGEELRKYTQDLADLGAEVARTQTEMTEAATGWLKAGYSEEDAALLSKYSALLQNTADEELSAADATSILVSQLKAYHMEAEEAIKVTDIINAVSAQQAVSSYDISQGLTVASAAMSTFGNSIEETTALLTAGTTIFQGRSTQVARGLNMIATRVAKNSDELKKYGVDINDANGQLKSTFEILRELSPAWEQMSKAEQVALGNTLAGTNQYKIFAAVMSQMDVAIESYDQALNSSGETMKQNAVYMESIEAKTTAMKAEFEKLVLGNGGLQDFAKTLIEVGTDTLKFINMLGGLPSILTIIMGLLVSINLINIGNWVKNVITGIQGLVTILPRAVNALRLYNLGLIESSALMESLVPVIGIVITTLSLLVAGITAYNRHLDEQKEKIKENISAFSQQISTIDETLNRLQDENITREELNSIINGNVDQYEAERLKLLDDNEARKETIELIEKEKKARAQEIVDTGLTTYEEALEKLNKGYEEVNELRREVFSADLETEYAQSVYDALQKTSLATATTAREQKQGLTEFRNELINLRNEQEKGSAKWTEYNNAAKRVETVLNDLNETYNKDKDIVDEFNNALSVLNLHYDETTNTIVNGSKKSYIAIEEEKKGKEKLLKVNKKEEESIDSLIKKYELEADAITETMESNEVSYEEAVRLLAEQSKAVEDSKKAWEELDKVYEESIKSSSALISSISSISSALEEQDKNGSIAVKTQLELIEAGYATALSYDKETGACKLNKDAVEKLIQAKLEMQIANLQIARSNIVNQLIEEANAATVAAGAFLELAKAKKVANDASLERSGADPSKSWAGWGGNFGYLTTESKKATEQIDKLNGEISALEASLKNVKTGGVGAFKATSGAAKQAKDAAKDLNQELEKLKSQYEKVISYLSSEYDRKISELEKAKDKELKAIDEEIEALEKEKDEEIKAIEKEIEEIKEKEKTLTEDVKKEIELLKKHKEELVKNLEEEIEALEKEKKEFKKVTDEKIKALEKEKKAYSEKMDLEIKGVEKEKDAFKKSIDAEIDVLEEKKKTFVKGIEKEADALKKEQKAIIKSIEEESKALKQQKEERQKYWEERIDALKKENDERKDAIELQEKLDAIERAKNTKVKIYKEGEGFVYDVDQTKVQQAQKELDEYLSEKAYEEELDRLNKLKDAELQNFTDRLDELNTYKEQVNEYYTQQLDDLDAYKEQEVAKLDAELEELKAYKEHRLEQYEEELEKLKQEKEDRLDQYDIELEELKAYEEHKLDEYEKEIENLKDQEEKIKEAYEEKIEDLERHLEEKREQYEKEIEDLEKRKDEIEENYEEEIENLKKHREAVEEEYDAEIEKYQEYKREFEEMVNAYEREQTRLLAEQLTGLSLENDNWMTRLENLSNFVNAYNALLAQLNTNVPSTPTETPTPTPAPTPTTPTTPTQTQEPKKGFVPTEVPIARSGEIILYSNGASSVKDDELAIVGENPNKEIVLGSKLNNGQLMSLNKGTGVVNANATNTLAGMLNQVGSFGSSGFGSGNGVLNNNINNDSLVVNGVTIQGSNISDPQTFVNGLLNLKSEALQRAYRRS